MVVVLSPHNREALSMDIDQIIAASSEKVRTERCSRRDLLVPVDQEKILQLVAVVQSSPEEGDTALELVLFAVTGCYIARNTPFPWNADTPTDVARWERCGTWTFGLLTLWESVAVHTDRDIVVRGAIFPLPEREALLVHGRTVGSLKRYASHDCGVLLTPEAVGKRFYSHSAACQGDLLSVVIEEIAASYATYRAQDGETATFSIGVNGHEPKNWEVVSLEVASEEIRHYWETETKRLAEKQAAVLRKVATALSAD